jgi:hypothetical protein
MKPKRPLLCSQKHNTDPLPDTDISVSYILTHICWRLVLILFFHLYLVFQVAPSPHIFQVINSVCMFHPLTPPPFKFALDEITDEHAMKLHTVVGSHCPSAETSSAGVNWNRASICERAIRLVIILWISHFSEPWPSVADCVRASSLCLPIKWREWTQFCVVLIDKHTILYIQHTGMGATRNIF